MSAAATTADLTERLIGFLGDYYRDEVGTLAQRYPKEQQSLRVDYDHLYNFDPGVAEDVLDEPEQLQSYLDEALRLYDLPADIDLANACVRVINLPEGRTFYPGHYSPTDMAGEYVAIKGEVVLASDVEPKIVEASFECQRCGVETYIPQEGSGFQEPHECQGCERQGPFQVNFDDSEFVDAQTLRVQEPPSVAGGGGRDITVMLVGELCDRVGVGDKVIVPGVLHLQQKTKGNEKTQRFEQYLDAAALEVAETDYRSLDIEPEERQEIEALANGAKGDPLGLAAESLSMKIVGHDHIKRAIILALVGGHRTIGPDGSVDRGDFHVLLLGDPGTGKSKLGDRAEKIAPRAVGVSGKNASEAGITASAVRDDLNDNQWTLDPGAFVKANGGLVWIDELDDMPSDVRASMLEPMSEQTINVNKAGINAELSTQTAVIAAGNPKYGRFDPYEPVSQQFEFASALLSRFDLIFTLSDKPELERDTEIATHTGLYRERSKRLERDPESLTEEEREQAEPPIDGELLAKWIALAKQQDAPFASEDLIRKKAESFAELRGANGYDHDSPIPTTHRKWEAQLRIAEAAAKFEFSDTIEERHFGIAMDLVGRSMQDYGKDEDGQFDTDVVETGQSKKTTDINKLVEEITEEVSDGEEVHRDEVIDAVQGEDSSIGESTVNDALEKLIHDRGYAIEPTAHETVKWLGRH